VRRGQDSVKEEKRDRKREEERARQCTVGGGEGQDTEEERARQ